MKRNKKKKNITESTKPVTNKVPLEELLRQFEEEEVPMPEEGMEGATVTFFKKTPKYPLNSKSKESNSA